MLTQRVSNQGHRCRAIFRHGLLHSGEDCRGSTVATIRVVDGNEVETLLCLFIRETIMNLDVGANSWEERGVQIFQEEISVRQVSLAGR